LPVGLVELNLGSQLPQGHGLAVVWQLEHLANVTKLQLPVLLEKSVLPPLLCLLACQLCSVQPLLPLGHLNRLLTWQPYDMDATAMRRLSALTQVTNFSVACCPSDVAAYVAMSDLPPLRKLTLQTFAGYRMQQVHRHDCLSFFGTDLVQHNHQSGLGLGQHLTCLVLQDLHVSHSAGGVGPQLKKFAALEELRLVRLYAWAQADPERQQRTCHSVGGVGVWCIFIEVFAQFHCV
jgi:hypothetical protein